MSLILLACSVLAGDQLLVGSYNSDSVARHDAATGAWISNFAAGGQDGVLGMDIGPDGALYVASEIGNTVERFDAHTGAHLSTFLWDDPSTVVNELGGLVEPCGVLFGPEGELYVTSFLQDAVYEFDGLGGAFRRILVPSASGGLNGPDAGIAIGPDGALYVPSYWNNTVKRYDRVSGAYLGNFVVPTGSGLQRPRTIRFPGDGFAYVASEGNDRVLRVEAFTGAFINAIVIDDPLTTQNETGGLDGPTGLAFGTDGRMYVASGNTNSVLRYDVSNGAFVDVFVAPGSGGSSFPTSLLFRPDVRVYGTRTPNSCGRGATLALQGSSSLAAQSARLELAGAPPGEPVLFFYGAAPAQLPFGDGQLLVQRHPIRRLAFSQADAFGRAQHWIDFVGAAASSLPFQAGSSRFFQCWTRDPAGPLGSGFNFSTALEWTFAP
ncbi:MAG: NHL repeat-containing protein [Planctomycetes bacterium]|nr:NHL repeat-containing protein [Planctomycetota bacterium]